MSSNFAPNFSGDQLIAKRLSEKFKRIKCSTLARLIMQNSQGEESIYQLGNADGMDSVSVMAGQNPQFMAPSEEAKDNQSSVSMRTGVSQATAVTYATDMLGITANTSFLLLDMRDPEDYNLWRIKESINFPAPNISRYKMIPELYRFKNQPEKLIIVYMLDERVGTQYAQMFTDKGFENLYLLSGGCEEFLERFSDLCEGRQVPVPKSQIEAAAAQRQAEKKEAAKQKHTQKIMTKF